MTHDDDFVRQLKTMAESTFPVTVDRQDVLRVGRRGLMARRGGVALLAFAAVTASAAGVQVLLPDPADLATPAPLAAPSDGATPTSSSPAPQQGAVTFDAETGTVVEPLDAWFWTPQEQAIQAAALEHFRTTCLAAAGVAGYQGIPAQITVPVIPDDGYTDYGLWDRSQLDRLGYSPRPQPNQVAPESAYADAATGDSAYNQAIACVGEAEAAGLVFDGEQIKDQGPEGIPPLNYIDEGRDVIDAWARCVREQGLEAADSTSFVGLVPTGAAEANPEEQSRIADIDLGCKERLGSVQALADLQAREQNDYIERAQNYLTEVRAAQQSVAATAAAYLEDNGITVPPYAPATSG